MPNIGDVAVRYSATLADRGIYLYGTAGWAKQSAPTVDMIAKAWPDICRATLAESAGGFAGGPYGTIADYIGTGVNFAEVLAIQTAFIQKLFAQQINVSGAITVGDRYNFDGTVADSSRDGIWQDGVTGRIKVAGIEFEGSRGGGVQWGNPTQIGTSLTIFAGGFAIAAASINSTDIAYIDASNDQLRTYRWSGNAWSQIGSGLSISSVGVPALAPIGNNQVAFIDSSNDQLRTYSWSGSAWSLVGSGLTITGAGGSSMSPLSNTDIAFSDANTDVLSVYRWNGSTWSQIGNSLTITGLSQQSISSLDGNTIALVDDGSNELRTYSWDGTDWAQIGNSFSLGSVGTPGITALNGTDVAFLDSSNDLFEIYRWDGTDWAQVSSAGSTGVSGGGPALVALNGTDVAFISSANGQLRTYRFSFATAIPYSRQITGM